MSIRDDERGGVLVHSFAGDDALAEKDRLRSEGLLNDGFGGRGSRSSRHRPAEATNRRTQLIDCSRTKDMALAIWAAATEPKDTIAETYLACRGIKLAPDCGAYVRFEPRCPFGRGNREPCLIALFRNILTSEPQGIQRTALTRDGAKIARKMLGPVSGAAIKIDDEIRGTRQPLGVAEGLETALSVHQASWQRIWAVGSAGAMRAMPLVPATELMIFADNDSSGVGQGAAFALQRRWFEGGQRASVQIPAIVGDFNDALMRTVHAGA